MSYNPSTHALAIEEADNLPDIDYRNIKKAAMIFRALDHKLRTLLLKTIQENHRYTVTEIYIKLQMEQSVVSQHLAVLRKAGIISSHRDGKYVSYTINPSRIGQINEFAKNLIEN